MKRLQSLAPKVKSVALSPFAPQASGGRAFARSTTAHLRVRGRALQARNARIALRDMYTCRACGRVTDKGEGEVDHRIPLALGGSEEWSNLQWLCHECHQKKTQQEKRARMHGG